MHRQTVPMMSDLKTSLRHILEVTCAACIHMAATLTAEFKLHVIVHLGGTCHACIIQHHNNNVKKTQQALKERSVSELVNVQARSVNAASL